MNKKIVLLLQWLWYIISILFINPWLLSYFFEENTVLSELLATLLSISLPTALLALLQNKEGTLLFNVKFKFPSSIRFYDFLPVVLGAILLFGGLSYLQNTVLLTEIIWKEDYSHILIYPKANFISCVVSVISYVIIPAIFEEILFRGIYADAFSADKKWLSVLISIASFSAMHSAGIGTLSAVAVGLFSIYCYDRFGSILSSILFHFFYNLLGLLSTNVFSLPFSALSVLQDYANKKQIIDAILVSIGLCGLCFSFLLLCFLRDSGEKNPFQTEPVPVKPLKWNMVYNIWFMVLALGTAVLKIVI